MGHSAGSHIAALLTLDGRYLKAVGLDRNVIRATATLSGPYDFTPNPWDRPVFGTATNPNIEPITFVDGKEPPMLLVQGMRDKIVSPANAVNLAARIRIMDGEVECITYPKRTVTPRWWLRWRGRISMARPRCWTMSQAILTGIDQTHQQEGGPDTVPRGAARPPNFLH